ncbi:hypothetical protein WDW37_02795 [Bdellovibrionota bacterium FG-1]
MTKLFGFIGVVLLVFGVGGCGQSPVPAPISAPGELQNTQGCLDFNKIVQAVSVSKVSRNVVTALTVLEDGTSVSRAMSRVLLESTALSESPPRMGNLNQNGCSSLVFHAGEPKVEVQLLEASPSRLVSGKLEGVESLYQGGYIQMSFEKTGDHQVKWTFNSPFGISHECLQATGGLEFHQVVTESLLDWGDELVSPPGASLKLQDTKARVSVINDADQARRERTFESSFCLSYPGAF